VKPTMLRPQSTSVLRTDHRHASKHVTRNHHHARPVVPLLPQGPKAGRWMLLPFQLMVCIGGAITCENEHAKPRKLGCACSLCKILRKDHA
jgi:hypothetical protein